MSLCELSLCPLYKHPDDTVAVTFSMMQLIIRSADNDPRNSGDDIRLPLNPWVNCSEGGRASPD